MRSLIARFEEAARTNNAALNADLLAEDVRLYGARHRSTERRARTTFRSTGARAHIGTSACAAAT